MQVRIVLRESQKRKQDAYLLSRLVGQLVGDFRDGASSKSKRPSSGKKKVASQDRVSGIGDYFEGYRTMENCDFENRLKYIIQSLF